MVSSYIERSTARSHDVFVFFLSRESRSECLTKKKNFSPLIPKWTSYQAPKSAQKSLLKRLSANGARSAGPSPHGSNGPHSPCYESLEDGTDAPVSPKFILDSPPAAPGFGERASLLASSSRPGPERRTREKSFKRGSSVTVGEAMIAAAAAVRGRGDSVGSSGRSLFGGVSRSNSVNDGGGGGGGSGIGGGGGAASGGDGSK